MPAPLFFRIDYGRVETAQCFAPEIIKEDREFFHDALDEFLDAYEEGKVYENGFEEYHGFSDIFELSPCEIHDERPDFSVFAVSNYNEAIATVPSGTTLDTDVKIPSSKVVTEEDKKRIKENSEAKEGDVIIAYMQKENASVDEPSAYRVLKWWAEANL